MGEECNTLGSDESSRRISNIDTTWKQERQCTDKCKIQARSISHSFVMQMHSRVYPKCKAHIPCPIVICVLSGSTILFPHYLINVTIFEKKKLLNIKCVLIYSTTFVENISHSKKN
jgi:hypothetical protein